MYQMTHFSFEYASFQILQGAFIKLTLALWSCQIISQMYFKSWKLNFFHTFKFFKFCAFIKIHEDFIKIIVTLSSSQIFEGQWKIWKKLRVILTFRFHEKSQKLHDFCSILKCSWGSHRHLSWKFAWKFMKGFMQVHAIAWKNFLTWRCFMKNFMKKLNTLDAQK